MSDDDGDDDDGFSERYDGDLMVMENGNAYQTLINKWNRQTVAFGLDK